MIKKLQLTPEELFYLGKLYEGKYLNYSYIKDMEDVGNNKRSFKGRCRQQLMDKGIIEENLMGDLTFNEEIKMFLEPIYFGEFSSTVEIYQIGDETLKKALDFHTYEGRWVLVWLENKTYQIRTITEFDLKQLIIALMPENYNDSKLPEAFNVTKDTLKRLLILKNIRVGGNAEINAYYDYDSYLFEKDEEGVLHVLSPKSFFDKAFACLKGDAGYGI